MFESATSRLAGLAPAAHGRAPRRAGFWAGLPVGVSLGLVWTPCVGPIMASVISLALTQRVDGGAVAITLAYTLGTSLPMLAVMLGGRALLERVPALTRNAARIQKGFGVLMIAVGVAIGLGWDRQFQAAVLRAVPGYGTGLTASRRPPPCARRSAAPATGRRDDGPRDGGQACSGARMRPRATGPGTARLGDYGAAPALVATGPWFNADGSAAAPHHGEPARQGGARRLLDLQLHQLRAHPPVPAGLARRLQRTRGS